MQEIFSFNAKDYTNDGDMLDLMGIRGRRLMELASLGLPILPGFIVTPSFINDDSLSEQCLKGFERMGKILQKKINDSKNPLLLKIVVSPLLNVPVPIASIHNIGLCNKTVEPFASFVGEDFAYHEYRNLAAQILNLAVAVEKNPKKAAEMENASKILKNGKTVEETKKNIEKYNFLLPDDVFSDSIVQFEYVLKLFNTYCQNSEVLEDSALLIQAMTFGNYGKDSFFGNYFTRDIVTGEKAAIFLKIHLTRPKAREPIYIN